MQGQTGGWEKAGNRKARLDAMSIDKKLVVVPAQGGIESPVSQMDQILDVGGLFKIRMILLKAECQRRIVIKLIGIGNKVAEIFIQENVIRLDAGFDLVSP